MKFAFPHRKGSCYVRRRLEDSVFCVVAVQTNKKTNFIRRLCRKNYQFSIFEPVMQKAIFRLVECTIIFFASRESRLHFQECSSRAPLPHSPRCTELVKRCLALQKLSKYCWRAQKRNRQRKAQQTTDWMRSLTPSNFFQIPTCPL